MNVSLPLLRRGQFYVSLDKSEREVADARIVIGLAPGLMLRDDARWFRQAMGMLTPLPDAARRYALLRAALALFGAGSVPMPGVGDQTPDDFRTLLRVTTGLPDSLHVRWCELLATTFEADAANMTPTPGIEAVSLPSNTFVCLSAVLSALMRADAVWVRPARQEPFSSARLVSALIASGWPAERLGFYPTTHDTLPALIAAVDRVTVFGGESLARVVGGCTRVAVHGPGRTRALVGAGVDIDAAADWLLGAVAAEGGRFCTNVGTILTAGNADALGAALAVQLDAIVLDGAGDACYPQAHPGYVVDPEAVETWIKARLRPGDHFLTRRPIVVRTSSGPTLAPCLIALAEPIGHPLLGAELPFAFAAIAAVPEGEQALLCSDAGFVYAMHSAAGNFVCGHAPRARVTEIALR